MKNLNAYKVTLNERKKNYKPKRKCKENEETKVEWKELEKTRM
jgi:hypothetical protein